MHVLHIMYFDLFTCMTCSYQPLPHYGLLPNTSIFYCFVFFLHGPLSVIKIACISNY